MKDTKTLTLRLSEELHGKVLKHQLEKGFRSMNSYIVEVLSESCKERVASQSLGEYLVDSGELQRTPRRTIIINL